MVPRKLAKSRCTSTNESCTRSEAAALGRRSESRDSLAIVSKNFRQPSNRRPARRSTHPGPAPSAARSGLEPRIFVAGALRQVRCALTKRRPRPITKEPLRQKAVASVLFQGPRRSKQRLANRSRIFEFRKFCRSQTSGSSAIGSLGGRGIGDAGHRGPGSQSPIHLMVNASAQIRLLFLPSLELPDCALVLATPMTRSRHPEKSAA